MSRRFVGNTMFFLAATMAASGRRRSLRKLGEDEPALGPVLGGALATLVFDRLVFAGDDQGLEGLAEARHQLYAMPSQWWRPDPSRAQRDCFQTKKEALMAFASYNSRVIDNYQGISHQESPAEFDSINAKYGLTGKDRVTTIAQALWVAMPPGRPYCLTQIDIESLNGTSAAKEDPLGVGFQIPDWAEAAKLNREQELIWRRAQEERDREPVPF